MTALVELIVSLIDLIKAEARDLQGGFFRLSLALIIIAAGVLFLVAGMALILVAIYISMCKATNAPIAALVTAGGCFAFAAIGLLVGTLKVKR